MSKKDDKNTEKPKPPAEVTTSRIVTNSDS